MSVTYSGVFFSSIFLCIGERHESRIKHELGGSLFTAVGMNRN